MTFTIFLQFLSLNLAILLSSLIIVVLLFNYKIKSATKFFLSISVIYFSQIILIEILLGIFAAISYFNVSLFGYLIFAFLAIFYGKKVLTQTKLEVKNKIPFFTLSAIFGPILLILFIRLFNAMLQIPLEYDNVAYHLPFMVEWLKSGSILTPYYSAFASPISYYPSNFELLDLWVTLPFLNDFFVNLINFPILILFGTAVYKVCQNFKIPKKISLLCTAFLIYMPIFLKQVGTPLVDLFVTLMFVLSVYFLQELFKSKNKKANSILFGLSLGLLVGSKYLGLVYGIIPLLFFFLIARKLKPILYGLGATFLSGSFFYIRNWIDTGNPLFPVELKLFGINIFEGYLGTNAKLSSTSLLDNVHDTETFRIFASNYFQMTGWQTILIFLFLFLALGFLIYKTFRSKKGKASRDIAIASLLLLTTTIYFYLYFRSPYSYQDLTQNIRYSMPFLVLGIINMGFLVSRIKLLKPLFYILSFLILSYSLLFLINFPFSLDLNILNNYQPYVAYLAISILFLVYGIFFKSFVKVRKKKLSTLFSLILIFLSILSFWKVAKFTFSERENLVPYYYQTWYEQDPPILHLMDASIWFKEHAPKAKIAYTGFNFHYHLYGRNLQREVDYININECLECRYKDYKNSKDSIRRDPDYQNWLNNLTNRKKEYIVIEPELTKGVKSYEFEWVNEHNEKFVEVFNKDNSYIYKILN